MKNKANQSENYVFKRLRQIANGSKAKELCEYCGIGLSYTHRHILEIATRKIICACDACGLLFENAVGGRKLIARDSRFLSDFRITDEQWETLALPIGLAFFFGSSTARRIVAMYPSPAGATESLLPLRSWEKLRTANPILATLEPDIEALLVNRLGAAREYYIVPIDRCYELVALIRLHWKGFSGGDRVFEKIQEFFERLQLGSHVRIEQTSLGNRKSSMRSSNSTGVAEAATLSQPCPS